MDDVHPKMRFSLTPPAPKAIFSSTINLGSKWNRESGVSKSEYQSGNNNNNNDNTNTNCNINCDKDTMQREEDRNSNKPSGDTAEAESTSDYKQWLHAMKLVARLPGGIPPEFRRKLWLSLADKYLKSKNVDWTKEEEKCFCEKWGEDDEELGIQIVKDLHRTGSTLCTGPAGDVNQAKLKRILLGYARYNPEVGYCQGFNMLGALILQVMDKEETESMKVMVYLVEGILPPGYFCGSMGGLQADMAVFRELMQTKLPRLARHLQKLQGPIENAYEPPLTNVFTMQWFLTMFCTCLPMSCVLRVWDLVLIEGSDVLLRTALALWSLLEDRVLSTRSADDFYGKMGSFSSELLNGHLIDSNGLIEKVVQLGPIQDIQKLRDKHLYSMTPLKHKQGLNLYYDDDEADMDEDSRLAVATVWGLPWGRRGSQGQTANSIAKQAAESKDRIALDISLLKKQYDRLRERQKQAHIILTTACSTARQSAGSNTYSTPLPVNQLLSGRPAIVTNKGRRCGPPSGAIPPARKPSLPAVLHDKPLEKQLRRGETLQWRDTNDTKRRRDSLTWKEIRAERASMSSSGSIEGMKSQKIRTKRLGKSDSSSYSEESEDEINDKAASSSDTSLCDDDNQAHVTGRKYPSSRGNTAKAKSLLARQRTFASSGNDNMDRQRPKSWAPSNSDIPFVLMTTESPNNSADECAGREQATSAYMELPKEEDEDEEEEEEENSATESDQNLFGKGNGASWNNGRYSPVKGEMAVLDLKPLHILADVDTPPTSLNMQQMTSPTADIISIIPTTKPTSPLAVTPHLMDSTNSLGSEDGEECDETKAFDVSDEGVTNQYFERVNSTERPTKLDLLYSLNEETSIRDAYKDSAKENGDGNHMKNNKNRCMNILVDYSEKSSAACIAEAKTEISTTLQKSEYSNKLEAIQITAAASKRRNPRRLTLTRSSTMEIEKRYQALEKRLSMEVSSKYRMPSIDKNSDTDNITAKDDVSDKDDSEIDKYRSSQVNAKCHELRDEDKETANKIVSLLQRKSKIPSTADLELRFANIVLDKVSKVSSMCDSEGSETSRKTPTSPKEATRRSSANAGTTKGPDKGDIKSKDTNVKNDVHSNVERLDDDSENNSENTEKVHDNTSATLSNVESEDSKSVTKENTLQRKKEPPDNSTAIESDGGTSLTRKDSKKPLQEDDRHERDTVKDKSSPDRDNKLSLNKSSSVKDIDKPSPVVKDKNEIKNKEDCSNQGEEQVPEPEANANLQTDKSNKDDDNQDVSRKVSSKNAAPKKSPPSTEELEKRFNALEKQMSITKTEPEEDEDEDDTSLTNNKEPGIAATPTENPKVDKQKTTEKESKSPEGVSQQNNNSTNMAHQVLEAMKSTPSRRASEPPSTEDLEKRYEVFKRRMSSKVLEMNRSKRNPSENLDDVEQDAQHISQSNRKHSTSKESPPSTDSLEKRFHKLQREADSGKSNKDGKIESKDITTKSKESFSDIMHMAVKAQKAMESPTTTKDSLSGIVQMAVEARKTTDSPTKSKESFSDIMHLAVKAQKAMESPTASKDSLSGIVQMAVDGRRTMETPTKTKESFSDIMQMAVKAQKHMESMETPTKSKDSSFSDIMQMAVKAQKAKDSPTASKDSLSAIVQMAVDSRKTTDSPTKNKESFSDIMHMAVKAQKAMESPTISKDSLSGIVQMAVEASKTTDSPTKRKDNLSDIMQMAAKAQKTMETPTKSKESFSDIMQLAVKAQKAMETPTKTKDGFSGIAQMAVEAHKTVETPTKSKESFSDIMQMAVKAQKNVETPTKIKDGFGDIAQMAVKAQRTMETPAKSKDSGLSGFAHMVAEAQKTMQTPTKSKDGLSGIVQMAVEAQKTSIEDSAEEEMQSSEISMPKSPLKETDKQGSRSALIEELQSKMSAAGDGEFIKPSSINPNRRTTQNTHILRKSNTDETSETHATTAYSKSEKYEHIHSPNRKMVRRFSDLPSRADLENRLLFLEEQLSKTLLQQRRASDSEVASHSRDHVRAPGTLRYAGKLEARVRELEKQLSATGKAPKQLDNLHIGTSRIPLEIHTDSIDATGKELVRYTHYGEIDEPDSHNPINISINIHMTLNKDDLEKSNSPSLSKAEEINKRLLILEQQLKTSQLNIASSGSVSKDLCESVKDTCLDPPASEILSENPTETEPDEPPESKIDESDLCTNAKDAPRTPNSPRNVEVDTDVDHILIVTENDSIDVKGDLVEQTVRKPSLDAAFEEEKAAKELKKSQDVARAEQSSLEDETAAKDIKRSQDIARAEASLLEDETAAKELKRSQDIARADDLDRRLLILEEHMRKSLPSHTAQDKDHLLTSTSSLKEDDADIPQTSRTKNDKQSKSEEPTLPVPVKAGEEHAKTTECNTEDAITNNVDQTNSIDNIAVDNGAKSMDTTDPNVECIADSKANETQIIHESEVRSNDMQLEAIDLSQMVPVEVNKKTLVLMLDNEPKAVKVRRLTRANTEELEGLFQALEQQLIERSQIKLDDVTAKTIQQETVNPKEVEPKSTQAMVDLTKEIEQLSQSCRTEKTPTAVKPKDYDDFDWGRDPVKHHLKKKTVYLPSTRELESRFRSLERQIKLLEDVEKIDVEQRLTEIDRKLKLQYSLSHEKDLVRFLDLCEGKGLDETPPPMEQYVAEQNECQDHFCEHTRYNTVKRHQSPARVLESEAIQQPPTEDPEHRYRAADLKKAKQKSAEKKREPIHPLEMLLDPSPDERNIPTTGELEHRMRVMEGNLRSPSPASQKSQSKSPVKRQTYTDVQTSESPSPTGRGLPTAEQLEARLAALEKEQRFDFKMQKNYKQFNQKLKDVISPSLSFEEFKAARSSSSESAPKNVHRSPSPRVAGCGTGDASCPKVIRFHEDDQQRHKSRNDTETMVSMSNDVIQILEENSYIIQRLLKKPIADTHCSAPAPVHSSIHEGLGVMGIRLMRETSPLRRKGTHTGVPLRTGENINDQLTSIKNTIKSIDSLCEEKPYRRERCQQYIDSLFTDSTYFASKKSSLDDLTSRHLSRSTSREYGPSIRISEHSPAFTRSIGSAESIRSSSPLRPTTPLQYHSNRDLRREISPRRRRDEEREENESRVRRDNLLPNIHTYNHSSLSHSLTKFHKVDSQLISNDVDVIDVELLETYRQPTAFSSNETSSIRDNNTNTSNTANTTKTPHTNAVPTNDTTFKGSILDRPISPYRQLGLARSNTPVYTPAKLEIRHTTVTSTFYDRVLAEKQLEKKHSTANASRSPLSELPIRPCFQTDKSPTSVPSPDFTAITLAGLDGTTGNYRSYQPAIVAKTPSPVIAKHTLPENQIISMHPKT